MAGTTSDQGPYAYQLSSPRGITVDPYSNIYVLDTGNSRVQKWSPGATYGITIIATPMSTPNALRIDNKGNLIITDTLNCRILSFTVSCRKFIITRFCKKQKNLLRLFISTFSFSNYHNSSTTV